MLYIGLSNLTQNSRTLFTVPCPYEALPGNESYFRSVNDHTQVQHCTEGMVFEADTSCSCLPTDDCKHTLRDTRLHYKMLSIGPRLVVTHFGRSALSGPTDWILRYPKTTFFHLTHLELQCRSGYMSTPKT